MMRKLSEHSMRVLVAAYVYCFSLKIQLTHHNFKVSKSSQNTFLWSLFHEKNAMSHVNYSHSSTYTISQNAQATKRISEEKEKMVSLRTRLLNHTWAGIFPSYYLHLLCGKIRQSLLSVAHFLHRSPH